MGRRINESLIGMENNKSNNNGLTQEFCHTFWNEIKNIFMNSVRESKFLKFLSCFYLVLARLHIQRQILRQKWKTQLT